MKLALLPFEKDDVIRLRCEGQVSLHGRPAQSDPLQELLGPHYATLRVLLNLEQARGIDTSGLTWLVRVTRKFAQEGEVWCSIWCPPW